ncbi:MAG: peptidylprolyl isomerase [Pirellulales bacterium]
MNLISRVSSKSRQQVPLRRPVGSVCRQRRLEVETLETRVVLSGSPGVAAGAGADPFIEPIEDVTLLAGAPLHIPLDGSDPDGGPLTYSVTSSNASLVSTFIPQGNRSLKITVDSFGDMVFELFEQRAPRVTQRIIELAESGFYDGVGFHRVIDNFMIQGGDPTGTGAGGSTLGDFDDQFDFDLQHTSSGILSMAKSDDDTNDSQFFITEGPQRHLDFNHSVFGQLVEGEAVREAISSVPTDGSNRPLNPVVMTKVEVIRDEENALVMLKADEGESGEAELTVTVSDAEGHQFERTFRVTVTPDPFNGGPYLDDIPLIREIIGSPVEFQLKGNDVEGDSVFFDALETGNVAYSFTVDSDTGEIVVVPPDGFVGTAQILVGVRPVTQSNTTDVWDTQVVSFEVRPVPLSGDMNHDDQVDFDDIDPFVLGLGDPAGYEAIYGVPATDNGDSDSDGDLDFDDIPPFVTLLGGVSVAASTTDTAAITATTPMRDVAALEELPIDSKATSGDIVGDLVQLGPSFAVWDVRPRDSRSEVMGRLEHLRAADHHPSGNAQSSSRLEERITKRLVKRTVSHLGHRSVREAARAEAHASAFAEAHDWLSPIDPRQLG